MIKKDFSFFLTAIFLILVFGSFFYNFQKLNKARAGLSQNLNGWAWSDIPNSTPGAPTAGLQGIGGWISFNSSNSGGVDYGVNVDTKDCSGGSSGVSCITGYAWSDIPNSPGGTPLGVGWISFNPSDWGGCPPSGPCEAHVVNATGLVKGWARALAAKDPQAGGWDGWISLSSDNDPPGTLTYGPGIGSCGWQGWAWGSDLIGWISFSSTTDSLTPPGVDYQVGGAGGCSSSSTLTISPPGPIILILVSKPTEQLHAFYDPDGPGGAPPTDVTDAAGWTSSDPASISVDKGLLSAVGNSQVSGITITATYTAGTSVQASVVASTLPKGNLKEIPPGGN